MKKNIYYIGEIVLISGIITDQIILFAISRLFKVSPEEIIKGRNYELILLFLLLSTAIIFLFFYLFQKMDIQSEKKLEIPIFKDFSKRTIQISLTAFTFLFLFMLVTSPLIKYFFNVDTFNNPLLENLKSGRDFLLMLICGVVGGALREELQRSFVLQRFEVIFNIPIVGLFIWSIYFAMGHLNQGVPAVFVIGFIGLGLGWLYLKFKKFDINFLTHTFFNIFTLLSFFIYKNFL